MLEIVATLSILADVFFLLFMLMFVTFILYIDYDTPGKHYNSLPISLGHFEDTTCFFVFFFMIFFIQGRLQLTQSQLIQIYRKDKRLQHTQH